MFWDKKKRDSGLPDLPSSPSMMSSPTLPTLREFTPVEENEPIHELPSFPDSPMQRGFSQSAIKEAVTNETTEDNLMQSMSTEEHTMPEEYTPNNNYKIVEMEEWTPSSRPTIPTPLPTPAPLPAPAKQKFSKVSQTPMAAMPEQHRAMFVRVDKFQNARASLDTIRGKLNDIEDLLKRIREVKSKEDAELSSWESDMENVKSRIQGVMREIFDKSDY